jgi:hypothetical protein
MTLNTTLSLLGAMMLILIGVAVVLAIVILILQEARWIVRLSRELARSTAAAGPSGGVPSSVSDREGGA